MYQMTTVQDIIDSINEVRVDWKESDNRFKLHHCPFCETDGTKEPFKNFSFDKETGQYRCFRENNCGVTGNVITFRKHFGIGDNYNDIKVYSRPKPVRYAPKSDVDVFYDWYEKERGISKDVLLSFNVSLMKNSRGKYIVYEYKNKDGLVFNRKYRNAANKKDMWTEKDCERDFYGKHTLANGFKEVYICEGEDDAHALYQLGFKHNVLSVPFGAGNYTRSMDMTIAQAETIYLIFDNDDAGLKGAETFARKAGIDRCKVVKLIGVKDIREGLIKGLTKEDVFNLLMFSEPVEHEHITSSFVDIGRDLIEYYSDNGGASQLTYTGYKELDNLVRGFGGGDLVVITGNTGSSKTTLGYNILNRIEQQRKNVMAFSFENQQRQVVRKILDIVTGEAYFVWSESKGRTVLSSGVTSDFVLAQCDRLQRGGWHLYRRKKSDRGDMTSERLRDIISDAVRFYNTEYFLIDHFHYLGIGGSDNVTMRYEKLVRDIKMIALEFNVVIFLVAHQSKVGQDRDGKQYAAGIDKIKGTSSIGQEADHVFTVEIMEGETEDGKGVSKVKYIKSREEGKKGEVFFSVDTNYNRFSEAYKENPVVHTEIVGTGEKIYGGFGFDPSDFK